MSNTPLVRIREKKVLEILDEDLAEINVYSNGDVTNILLVQLIRDLSKIYYNMPDDRR